MVEPSHLTETIAEQLFHYIQSVDVGASGRLPPERELSARFAVSRVTLRKALGLLASQGRVSSAPQSGWFVTDVPYGPPPRQLLSFTEMARRRGLEVRTRVTERLTRPCRAEEKLRLQPKGSDTILELERIRFIEGEPICVERSVVALWHAPGLDLVDFTDQSLYSLLEQRGAVPTRSDFVISASLAGAAAVPLEIEPHDPILIGEELSHNQHGSPLVLSTSSYRASAYRFQASLTASRQGRP
jgi:GntR family transcriptional regulator